MPWIAPAKGAEPFSFPYWVPWVSGISVLTFCFLYWFTWTHVLPRIFGYKIYEEVVRQKNGELSKQFIRSTMIIEGMIGEGNLAQRRRRTRKGVPINRTPK